jgi:predicted hydrocarbon binding protein
LKPGPKYVSVALFDPEKDIFLVSMQTKNVPGALGDIAARVGKAGINILSVSNYSEPGKPESNLSFFAEPGKRTLTEEDFAKILSASPYVLDVYTRKSEGSFAVDDVSFPLIYYPGGRGILFPVSGIASMFSDMVSLFGSGGEAILFRAGYSIGRQGTEDLARLFGEEHMLEAANVYDKLFDALGWGKMEVVEASQDMSEYTLRVHESFECSGRKTTKPTGHFVRGLISGSADILLKKSVTCIEDKCVAKGDPFCQFRFKI